MAQFRLETSELGKPELWTIFSPFFLSLYLVYFYFPPSICLFYTTHTYNTAAATIK